MDAASRPTAVHEGEPRLGGAALGDIVAGLASVPRSVPLREDDDVGQPRSLRLLGTAGYDVWLITWPPGSGIGVHDHGGALGVMRVVAGELDEEGRGSLRRVRPGVTVTVRPGAAHRLANPGPGEATSLHAYSPALVAVTYHAGPSGRTGRRVAPVRSRRAEATAPSP